MQSSRELFPGIKLFFQLGNFFIMDSETLAVNVYQETQQAAISEVLKKNSLTEKVTSIKNRVCQNHFNLTRSGLDNQRARRLRQLLDHSITLRHEVRLLQLDRQRQAMEVKKRLYPDAHLKYEDIRLSTRERHLGVSTAPCYLDKRQQFPMRLRSTRDNSLTPTVRTARARLKQHQLEDCMKNDPSENSSSSTPHDAKPTTLIPQAAPSTGLQQGSHKRVSVSALSEPGTRTQPGFCRPTGLSYPASSFGNSATSPDNHTILPHYTRTQSTLNNHTKQKHSWAKPRNTSHSYSTTRPLSKHAQISLSTHLYSVYNHTCSSLLNHTHTASSNVIMPSNNPTNSLLHNHTSTSSNKVPQDQSVSDRNVNGQHSTNEMHDNIVSSKYRSGKHIRSSHLCDAVPLNTTTREVCFSDGNDDDDDDGANSHSGLDVIDLRAYFCGHQKNNFPSAKPACANPLLCEPRKQNQTLPKLPCRTRSQTTDIQVRVAQFLKSLPPSPNKNDTMTVGDVLLVSPNQPTTLHSSKDTPSTSISQTKPVISPAIINPNINAISDNTMPKDDSDENAEEIQTSNTVGTTPRKSRYSWRDIKVRPREGPPGVCLSAEDLVLQALTGIPIRNVLQSPVPLNTATRAIRHTATYKLHKIVETMIKDRTRYQRHQVEELKKQMAGELQGEVVGGGEPFDLTVHTKPNIIP